MRLGMGEILLVLAIVLLLFGAKRLPALAEGLGKGIRSFKKSVSGDDEPEAPKARSESEADVAGTDAARTSEREKEHV